MELSRRAFGKAIGATVVAATVSTFMTACLASAQSYFGKTVTIIDCTVRAGWFGGRRFPSGG